MKRLITILCAFISISTLSAQISITNLLTEIEQNNTRLAAVRKSAEAMLIENKTGNYLNNPEVEFHFLNGNPSPLGKRTDFSISQSFDFPTAYKYRNQISKSKNKQVETMYLKERNSLLFDAHLLCLDLIYSNALMAELNKRLNHAQSIARSTKAEFEVGETNILVYNKAQLNLLNLSNEIEILEIDRKLIRSKLSSMNGGKEANLNDSVYIPAEIPENFDQWYTIAASNNPVLAWLKQEIEISRQQKQLSKALSMPKMAAGYLSEKVAGEQFQGVSLGLTIPLWENKNTTKLATANTIALTFEKQDMELQLYNELQILHAKALNLQNSLNNYRAKLTEFDNTALLKKALDAGEITMIEYLLELSFYYESKNKLLEMERKKCKAVAELNQFSL